MNNNLHKKCARCQFDLPIGEFADHKKTKDKLQSWCNPCRRAYALDKYNLNKIKYNARRRQYYADHEKQKTKPAINKQNFD